MLLLIESAKLKMWLIGLKKIIVSTYHKTLVMFFHLISLKFLARSIKYDLGHYSFIFYPYLKNCHDMK